MRTDNTRRKRGLAAAPGRILLGATLALSLTACDTEDILRVEDPDFPTTESLAQPQALPLLVRGALGEFFSGYSGSGLSNLGFLTAVALYTDEFMTSDTFVDRNAMDKRTLLPPSNGNPSDLAYSRLQRARRAAKDAAVAVTQVHGANHPDRALLKAIEGYALVALAEGWCGAVPISNVVGAEFQTGDPLTNQQLLDTALVRFNESLAIQQTDLARVGRARALLDQGKFAEAAAAVNAVPTTFRFLIEHSENTFQNPVWNLNNSNIRMTVWDNEGGNGLNFRSANDPRVPVTRQGNRLGFDNQTPLFEQQKYPNRDADVVLADGREARLIEAEAALRAGDVSTFLARLNALRATVSGLAPLTDPGNATARQNLLFRERAFWLYLTGHRLGDYRRLVTYYGRNPETVYPSGAYSGAEGGTYGNNTTFPVPFNEEQNPKFKREMCNTTVATLQ